LKNKPWYYVVSDEDTIHKFCASADEKLALLNIYRRIIEEYKISCSIDIFSDYYSILSNQERSSSKILTR